MLVARAGSHLPIARSARFDMCWKNKENLWRRSALYPALTGGAEAGRTHCPSRHRAAVTLAKERAAANDSPPHYLAGAPGVSRT
jgi:hypothetical protein